MAQFSEQEIFNKTYIEATSAIRVGASVTFSGDASQNRVSSVQGDAGLLHISSYPNFNGDAVTNRVSAFQKTATDLMNCPNQGDAALLHVSAIVDRGSVSAMQGIADNLRVSAFSKDAATFMVSGRSDDAALFHVSAIGTLTVSSHEVKQSDAASLRCSAIIDFGSISAKQTAANNLMVSGRSDDAALFHVSAIGTLTVSAHEVKQSDATSLMVSGRNNDAALFRVSAFTLPAGDPSYTVIRKDGRCSATGGVATWTPGAGKALRVTDAVFSSVSANVIYLIGAANALRTGPVFLAANGGWSANLVTPLTLSANEVLGISTDNANSVGYLLNGYEV